MNLDTVHLFAIAGGYLLGAVPFGLLLTLLAGKGDIRTQGSGNIGATNVLRTAGKLLGAATLLLDMAKGFLPMLLASHVWGKDDRATLLLALALFLGHLFPIYLRFRGGKGVATGLGIFLAWAPWVGGSMIVLWLVMAKVFRYSSLAALTAFVLPIPVLYLLEAGNAWVASLVITPLVFWKHRQNIRRLLRGEEPRIGNKGGQG